MSTHVFVYGTLREGEANWRTLLSPAQGCSAKSEPHFTMRSHGRFPVVEHSGITAITGEVFLVDDATLAMLDQLEGHPGWYERIEIDVTLNGGELQRAWIYLMPMGEYEQSPVVESGDWCCRG